MEAVSIDWFAEVVDISSFTGQYDSFVNQGGEVTVFLKSESHNLISENYSVQGFEFDLLVPIALEIGANDLSKIAELLALRNAWLDFHSREIESPYYSVEEIRIEISNEFLFSYFILCSSRWYKHPWVLSQIYCHSDQNRNEPKTKDPVTERSNDIQYFIKLYKDEKNEFSTELEFDVKNAKLDIKRANRRIAILQTEILKQETIINIAMRPIIKQKKIEKKTVNKSPGRPKLTGEQKNKTDTSKNFVMLWITSLMNLLSTDNCGELATTLGGQKMTWWRWKNKETLPPLRMLYALSNSQIKKGKHKGIKLSDIPTTPSLYELITLIELI